MKYLWTNHKDKMVLSEEGKVDENLERVPKPNKCRIVMKILKVILAVEIILLVGSAVLLLYKSEYYDAAKSEKIETELNSASFLPTLKLTGENLNNDKTIDNENPNSKTDELLNIKNLLNSYKEEEKEKIFQNELSQNNELPNGENNPKSEEKSSNQEISSPNEPIFKKIFSFRFSLPFNKEIVDPQENENSPAISDDPKNDSFHIRILFKAKNPNEKNNQTEGNIIDPLQINHNPIIPILNDIENEELSNQNIPNNNMDGFDNFWSTFMNPDIVSDFFNPYNEKNLNTETDDFGRILSPNTFEEEKQEEVPSSFQNILEALNMKPFNHESHILVV
ncbi:uncharacterized protein LOC122511662 [Leptopilina heterotoma]|uniref:uncharacterized protein LOC122511662 n=1 Tax=Leptopilina heterotoma TaxID=63436 RepID=UPI001CA9B5E0|nr:uncharacterized protein LOC122511662 [Leptopilina heterotoma]